jgi:hypothetical protein
MQCAAQSRRRQGKWRQAHQGRTEHWPDVAAINQAHSLDLLQRVQRKPCYTMWACMQKASTYIRRRSTNFYKHVTRHTMARAGQRSHRKRKVTADSEGEASADDASSQADTDVETTMAAGKDYSAFGMLRGLPTTAITSSVCTLPVTCICRS